MSKYLLALIFSTSSLILISQATDVPVDEETGKIMYREVVEQKGTKTEFFNRAISWINSFYKNPVAVTKTRDPESGVIRGLHRIKLKDTMDDGTRTDAGTVQYEFSIELKDGRYRYTLHEFILRQQSKIPVEKWLNQNNPKLRSYLKQINDFSTNWITSLKKGMLPKVEKSDEW